MFFGFVIGTLCLVGLVRVLSGRRYYRGFHHYGGYGGYGYPPWGWGYGGPHFGDRGRGMIYSVLARLDATPSQEKAILSAIDELKESARELRGAVRETRADVARTMREPHFDTSALANTEHRLDDAAQKLRTVATGTLGKVHGVLDERQRKMLGEMIESGRAAGC